MRRTPRTRHVVTSLLAALLSVTVALPATAAAGEGFGDVEPDAYYSEAVAWMVTEGITTGIETGCFGPTLDVTRGQVATFLYRLDRSLGHEPVTADHPFTDVTAEYQRDPVGWLYGRQLTTGVSPTRFAPTKSITRGELAVLIWRYAGSPSAVETSPFVDVTRDYQREAIAWMAETGITTGTSPTTFDPDGLVTRAQAATFLHRYVGPSGVAPSLTTGPCTREIRIALEIGGLTRPEAMCAAPWLTDFDVEYLLDVVEDRAPASFDLIVIAAGIGAECLHPDRVADLSRLFL